MKNETLKELVQTTRLQACKDLEETINRIVAEINKQKITEETNFLQVHLANDCLAGIMELQHDLHTLWQTL